MYLGLAERERKGRFYEHILSLKHKKCAIRQHFQVTTGTLKGFHEHETILSMYSDSDRKQKTENFYLFGKKVLEMQPTKLDSFAF